MTAHNTPGAVAVAGPDRVEQKLMFFGGHFDKLRFFSITFLCQRFQ